MIPHTTVTLPDTEVLAFWIKKGFSAYGAVPFHGTPDAPNSWKALQVWASTHTFGVDSLPVFNGACESSIYGSDIEGNMLFRAWHDCIHIRENLGFSEKEEIAVSGFHCSILNWIGAPYAVIKAVEADVKGQVMYYFRHGRYVENQKAFVSACLTAGIENTIESGKIY